MEKVHIELSEEMIAELKALDRPERGCEVQELVRDERQWAVNRILQMEKQVPALADRITHLESQLQSIKTERDSIRRDLQSVLNLQSTLDSQSTEETHAREVGRLEGEKKTMEENILAIRAAWTDGNCCEMHWVELLSEAIGAASGDLVGGAESQLPRWRLVSEGWPTVEGLYLIQLRPGPYAFTQSWHGPESLRYWKQQGVERFISVADLLKLPGGPG